MACKLHEITEGCGGPHGQVYAGFIRLNDTEWVHVDAIRMLVVAPEGLVVVHVADVEVYKVIWEHGLQDLLRCLGEARKS